MYDFKRVIAGIAAVSMFSFTGCSIGDSTSYVLTANGKKVDAGIYIYYAQSAYSQAMQELSAGNSNFDTSDKKAVKKAEIDGKKTETWIKDKATELCEDYVAINEEFDKLGLKLSKDQKSEVDAYAKQYIDSYGDALKKAGVSENSLKEVLTSNYKSEAVFDYYYAVGGKEGVKEDELKDYYVDNNARVRLLTFSNTDSDGNVLKGKDKKALKKKVNKWYKEIKGSPEEMEDEMDEIQDEYNDYLAKQSGENATDENGETIAETTEETTEAEDTTEAEEESTETAADDAVEEKVTEEESEVVSDRGAEDTTEADDEEKPEEGETTTTTSPYENETIISKYVTTTDEEGNTEAEKDIQYTPSKTVQMALFNKNDDNYTKDGKLSELIFDDSTNSYYIILRLNIKDRMNDDDLWTDDQMEDVALIKYNDAFQKKLEGWVSKLDVDKNDAAFKRYDVMNIDLYGSSTSN